MNTLKVCGLVSLIGGTYLLARQWGAATALAILFMLVGVASIFRRET